MACLTGLVTLTYSHIYDLHYSTHTRVPGSVSIHILRTVVHDYRELLTYWFILHNDAVAATAAIATDGHKEEEDETKEMKSMLTMSTSMTRFDDDDGMMRGGQRQVGSLQDLHPPSEAIIN